MIAAGDIAINRLRIRASKRDMHAVTSDMIHGGWSVDDQDQWLFIRKIAVNSRKFDLRRHASDAVNTAISQAVDGRLSGAASANAVRFSSYVEMLAYLLQDLADGSAVQRWYWQRWRYLMAETRGLAVARVLWENTEYLGALVEQLRAIKQLENIWRQLSHQSAGQIIRQLQLVSPAAECVTPMTALPVTDASISTLKTDFLRSKLNLVHAWMAPLAGLDLADNRFRLAAVITGRHHYPLLVARDQAMFIAAFSAALHAFDDSTTRKNEEKPVSGVLAMNVARTEAEYTRPGIGSRDSGGSALQQYPLEARSTADTGKVARAIEAATPDSRPGIATGIRAVPDRATETKHSATVSRQGQLPVQHRVARNQTPDTRVGQQHGMGERAVTGGTFTTQAAGFFYLINAIRDETCQAVLAGGIDHGYNCGWLWLFDLARCMGAELDQDLLVFVSDQCGLPDEDALLSLPPLAEVAQIESVVSARYANLDVWNESLVQTPACVVFTASHVDVFYPLQCVRLPVRLAGLDVNPGWVPWLGRVVTFHYRESGSLPFAVDGMLPS